MRGAAGSWWGSVGIVVLVPARPVDWKRNLAALWAAELVAIFGFSFAFPFLPLYLHQDLGVRTTHDLALWSGVIGGASGLSMAIASPIWGVLADRHGRKPMLVRAMLGGAITVGLMSIAQTAPQLLALRTVQGATSGTVPAATALAAAEAPRSRVAWSMGVLSSAVALGGAMAPLIGGLAAVVFGLRTVFLGAGMLLALSSLPVLLVVRESPRPGPKERASGDRAGLRGLTRPLLLAVAVLVAGQALMQFSWASAQQLAVLHILQVSPVGTSAVTGVAFAVAGLATTCAAITSPRLVRWAGYRWVAVLAALLLAASIAALALAGSVVGILAAVTGFGLAYGGLNPALAAMIGLRAPREVQATVYGLSASAIAIGFGLGPLVSGAVAATLSVSAGLLVAAGVAAILSLFLATLVREPRAPTP
jgi:MFS transporter, DHA1 family, multidrug resistance protein